MAGSDVTGRDRGHTFGVLSLRAALVPPMIYGPVLGAFVAGLPSPAWWLVVGVLVAHGLSALLAVTWGLAACAGGRLRARGVIGIFLGSLELALLAALLNGSPVMR